MAEYSAPGSLVTPGGTIAFNGVSPYQHDPGQCSGLDQAPLRTPIDPRPQTHGAIVHPFLRGARHVTLGGEIDPPDVATRNALADALQLALESIEQADGTYSWTPAGSGARSLIVRCDQPLVTRGYWIKAYLFGLVAADPTIT